jgi:hypothetical protein
MPDNTPHVTGDPVTAAEIVGHWVKLVGQGDPEIDIRPAVVEGVVNLLADELLAQIPVITEDYPVYMHISTVLDGGAVADMTTGGYIAFDLPESQQVAPTEQPDGSLLFEGSNLELFLQRVIPHGRACGRARHSQGGLTLEGMPVSDMVFKLWLYRADESDDILSRVSAEASIDVPLVGHVQVRVTLDGRAYVSEGPEADGLVPGEFDY